MKSMFFKETSMKKVILLTAVILLSTAGLAQAQEAELHGVVDMTYLSSYIWRGFDMYAEGHSALQSSIDIDWYGTGFGTTLFWSRAVGSGFENTEWLNTTLYYGNRILEGETYATNYRVGWTYYNFPDQPRRGGSVTNGGDQQEFFAALAWPDICPAGIVPSYIIVCMWPAQSNSNASGTGGWAHIFGLDYALSIPPIIPETTEQVLNLHAEAIYNDGVGPAGETVDHDWSNAVFGVSTDFDLGNNLTFTPGFYYQSSWDDSVNDDDETWVSLSMKYRF